MDSVDVNVPKDTGFIFTDDAVQMCKYQLIESW
jgi:hypothetical protein